MIYDQQNSYGKYEELEEEGQWDWRYNNSACCVGCYLDLRNHIQSEYDLMIQRRGELNENDEEHPNPDPVNPDAPPYGSSPEYEDPPAYDEPIEIFNYDWKPIAIRIRINI